MRPSVVETSFIVGYMASISASAEGLPVLVWSVVSISFPFYELPFARIEGQAGECRRLPIVFVGEGIVFKHNACVLPRLRF